MNRRDLLKRAAAFGAALALPVVHEAQSVPADDAPDFANDGIVDSPMTILLGGGGPTECIVPLDFEAAGAATMNSFFDGLEPDKHIVDMEPIKYIVDVETVARSKHSSEVRMTSCYAVYSNGETMRL